MKRRGTLKHRLKTSHLAPYIKAGLRALGNDGKVILEVSRLLATDSLSFDDVAPNSPTFDYLVGVPTAAVALEVHPAQTHEMRRIVEKKLRTRALLSTCTIERWCWAPTKGVHLPTTTRARILLAEHGIAWPVGQIDLRQL